MNRHQPYVCTPYFLIFLEPSSEKSRPGLSLALIEIDLFLIDRNLLSSLVQNLFFLSQVKSSKGYES